ncbi:MAG: glycerol-3-phosphate acyltransferase [Clostridia bacterium]|nr:glycerol-3-phosphate acyltransferase [Clostridia bacterium]
MYYFLCILIGYLLGCISPSYILGKIMGIELRGGGTKNLGASNSFIHLGRGLGALVMLFDIFKAFFAAHICSRLSIDLPLAGIVAGSACVLGHNYPFYLGFKGGKGLACYGGLALWVSPSLFLVLLVASLFLALIFNYGCVVAISAAVLFPFLSFVKFKSLAVFFILAACSASVLIKHTENLRRIQRGEETKFRAFIGKYILKR